MVSDSFDPQPTEEDKRAEEIHNRRIRAMQERISAGLPAVGGCWDEEE